MFNQTMKPRVLIANKDAYDSHLYANILEKAGYRVHLATTLPKTQALLARYTFAVLLYDLDLEPDTTGEFLRQYCSCWSSTRLIILADEKVDLDYADLGADFCLSQPAGAESLLSLTAYLKQLSRHLTLELPLTLEHSQFMNMSLTPQ